MQFRPTAHSARKKWNKKLSKSNQREEEPCLPSTLCLIILLLSFASFPASQKQLTFHFLRVQRARWNEKMQRLSKSKWNFAWEKVTGRERERERCNSVWRELKKWLLSCKIEIWKEQSKLLRRLVSKLLFLSGSLLVSPWPFWSPCACFWHLLFGFTRMQWVSQSYLCRVTLPTHTLTHTQLQPFIFSPFDVWIHLANLILQPENKEEQNTQRHRGQRRSGPFNVGHFSHWKTYYTCHGEQEEHFYSDRAKWQSLRGCKLTKAQKEAQMCPHCLSASRKGAK